MITLLSSLVTRQNLLGYWLAALLIFIGQSAQADTLAASVDRDTISLQETLTLTLRYHAQTSETPDFSLLQKDFDILSTQRSNQMRVINGDMESFTDWRIALAPKRTGDLAIPVFTVEGVQSNSINITVESQSRAPQNASSNVFVDVSVDKNSVYVQEQILFTVRLYTAVNLNGAEMQPLEMKDALVIDLGEKQFQTSINGRQHIVVERVYGVYPQNSGDLVIPSLTYNVSTSSGQRDLWGSLNNRSSNLLRLRTEEQKISIKTIPSQFNGQAWMPAKKLELTEHWSSDVEQLKVGEPVTRTITMTTEGLTAGQLAPLSLPTVDGLTFYPDQAQNDDQSSDKGVRGSRIETLAVIPNRAGDFTLPAISVNWWDTVNQKMQTATLPEKTIRVEDTLASLAIPEPQQAPVIEQTPLDMNNQADSPEKNTAATHTKLPLWLAILTVLLGLTALAFAWLYWRARRELRAIHSLNAADHSKNNLAENAAWAELKRASAKQDYPALRVALVQWAQAHWQDPHLHNLNAIADKAKDKELREQLKNLDAAIYRNEASSAWDSGDLLQQINKCRKNKRDQKTTSESLAPLYKS